MFPSFADNTTRLTGWKPVSLSCGSSRFPELRRSEAEITPAVNRSFIRILLLLGRVSNLPTVWSNCLAAWLLCSHSGASHASWTRLALLCVGCSLLYLGGMFLNDAFDIAFDSQHRPERPIPSGRIARRTVLILGVAWLAAGLLLLVPLAGGWAFALAGSILAYNAVHKQTAALGLPLMVACRALIYPLVGAACGFTRWAIPLPLWGAALAMAGWVLVISIGARAETRPEASTKWTLLPWLVPVWMVVFRTGSGSLLAVMPLLAWLGRCTLLARWRNGLAGAVPDLLAGIPLVDLLSVSPQSGLDSVPFLAFTALALFLRRNIPPS